MKRGLGWFVAGAFVLAGGLVAGCPDEGVSSDAARPVPAKARDYLFPSSAQATYVYEQTLTRWSSDRDGPEVSTLSVRVKTIRLTEIEALLVYDMLDVPVLGTVPLATESLRVGADGAVTVESVTILGAGGSFSVTDAALTSKGAAIRPASGSTPALVMARSAKETVTVPAGSYETLKVKKQAGSDEAPRYVWLAKGMGFFGVKQAETSTASFSDDTISTTSTEVVLKSFTP